MTRELLCKYTRELQQQNILKDKIKALLTHDMKVEYIRWVDSRGRNFYKGLEVSWVLDAYDWESIMERKTFLEWLEATK